MEKLMHYTNLTSFIKALDKAGQLKRIAAPVSPYLEIAEIADRISKSNGPALLFENIVGSDFPVLINAYGSPRRMAMALSSLDIEDLAARIESLVKTQPPQGLLEKVKMLFTLKELSDILPHEISHAPCQQVIYDSGPLLDRLPVLTTWPHDGGPFFTLPVVITRDPDTGVQNAGMYRMQKFDNTTTGMHWQYNKDGAHHCRKYAERGMRMPVAVALGGNPAVAYAATAPLPPDIDEFLFAGFLCGKPVELVRARTSQLLVPAESDFIMEGWVDATETRTEGPFGDHTGFYSASDTYPVFHVECITHRKDAVFCATVVGKPPMEDCYMAKATERLFLPLLKMIVPEIRDINLPIEGVFHNCALISIDKKYSGQAKKTIHALWGLLQMSSSKFIAVFDADVDVQNTSQTVWKLLNNVDPRRDIILSDGPLDALDHSAQFANYGSKMGIDATRKTREEGMGRDWPEEIKMDESIIQLVNARWKEYGF